LVEQGEYGICYYYLADLEEQLGGIRQSRQLTLEIAEENIVLGSPQVGFKAFANLKFEEEISRLIAILEGVGRLTDADRVREFVHESGK
jgi:hypothetical protein